MATRTPKIRLLRDKRRALDDQIVKAEAELAQLKEEAKEFEIAERVLLSLGDDDEEDEGQGIAPAAVAASLTVGSPTTMSAVAKAMVGGTDSFVTSGRDATQTEAPFGKPPNIPSTPEMIFIALRELTSSAGTSKMKAPFEIMEFIRKRWWPSVTSKDISPVVWRLANERRLLKDDAGNYGLPTFRRLLPGVGSDNNAV
jgi:hypothetical protein